MISTKRSWTRFGVIALSALFLSATVLLAEADARAGGSRSSGSRGSRSAYSAKSAPSHSYATPSRNVTPAQPIAPAAPQKSGGFWRTFAGGMAGGLLGGLLFSSLGHGFGGGGFGGGIGLLDILLIGGLLFFLYRFLKRRREEAPSAPGAAYTQTTPQPMQPSSYGAGYAPTPSYAPEPQAVEDPLRGLEHIRQMDPGFSEDRFRDLASDIFFRIQGAWTNRDMASARASLTGEMFSTLQGEADRLKQERKLNHLENIAVRQVELVEAWQEQGSDYITVRFLASLLDYTTTDAGELVSGNKTEPVKFEEYWTFVRPVGNNPWQLTAIDQAD